MGLPGPHLNANLDISYEILPSRFLLVVVIMATLSKHTLMLREMFHFPKSRVLLL